MKWSPDTIKADGDHWVSSCSLDVVGLDPATVVEGETQSGWGLVGIRERVQLVGCDRHIESTPGAGASLTVEIPLLAEKGRQDGAH